MVTTTVAKGILEARGVNAPYQTLIRWVRGGLFKGAKLDESNPRGAVWLIPEDSVKHFVPPDRGRPSKKAGKKGGKR